MEFIKRITKAIYKILMTVVDNAIDFIAGPMIDMATEENLNYYTTSFGIIIRVIFVLSLFMTVPQFLLSVSLFFLKISFGVCILATVAEVFMVLKGVDQSKMNSWFDTKQPINV